MRKLVFLAAFCLISSLAICHPSQINNATRPGSVIDNPGKHRHHVGRARRSRKGDRVVRTYHQPYAKTFHVSNRISNILK